MQKLQQVAMIESNITSLSIAFLQSLKGEEVTAKLYVELVTKVTLD